MMRYLLAHDIGTSGDKATLFAEDGTLIGSILGEYPTHYDRGGVVEQHRRTGGGRSARRRRKWQSWWIKRALPPCPLAGSRWAAPASTGRAAAEKFDHLGGYPFGARGKIH